MNSPIKISKISLDIIKNVLDRHYKTEFYTRKIPEFIYFIYIIHCIKTNAFWKYFTATYNGVTIYGSYLSFKNREYIKKGIYDEIHKLVVTKYLDVTDQYFLNILSTDTSFIENKRCNIRARNRYCSRKTGLKISTLVDDNSANLCSCDK